LGFRKKDAVRFKFMRQSVLDLRKNLESLDGHLVIGETSAMDTIPELVEAYEITDIYGEEEYAPYELNLVKAVMHRLPAITFHFFWGKTLYHKDDYLALGCISAREICETVKAYESKIKKNQSTCRHLRSGIPPRPPIQQIQGTGIYSEVDT